MALIKCPECGKDISDKAPACIHCGCQIEKIEYSVQQQQSITDAVEKNSILAVNWKFFATIILTFIVGVLFTLMITQRNVLSENEKEQPDRNPTMATEAIVHSSHEATIAETIVEEIVVETTESLEIGVVKNIYTAADIPDNLMNAELKNTIALFSKGFLQSGLDITNATTYDNGETYIFYLDSLEFLGDACEDGALQPRIIYSKDAINNNGMPKMLFFEIANPLKSNGYKETVKIVEDIAEALDISDAGLIDNDYSSSSKWATGKYATFTFPNLNFTLTVSNTDGTVEIEIVPIEEIRIDNRTDETNNLDINSSNTPIDVDHDPNVPLEVEYGFIDYKDFSQYWFDGIYRCGTDFEEGEYYILPLFSAGAIYEVSDSPNGWSWTYYRALRKISPKQGQYVNVAHGAIMVPADEVDTDNWTKYGVFLVGQDIPSGNYKMETLTDTYYSELYHVKGICGVYQHNARAVEDKPLESNLLFETQKYITLKDGQYLVLSNVKLTCVDNAEKNSNSPETPSTSSDKDALLISVEHGILDYTVFDQYWADGMYRCGTDFEAGEYYILPLYGAGAGYTISSSPNDVVWTERRLLKKVTVETGQYVNLVKGAMMVPEDEVDTSNWSKYGVFLVGKDLRAGDYKIEVLKNMYSSTFYSGVPNVGEYQVCENSPESTPINSAFISGPSYITLKDGQYIILSHIKMTLVS